jgi:hypothetical protein
MKYSKIEMIEMLEENAKPNPANPRNLHPNAKEEPTENKHVGQNTYKNIHKLYI